MCNPDTGVLGQVWFDRDDPAAFPDFNTKHKCKNFDDISRWAVENQVRAPPTLGVYICSSTGQTAGEAKADTPMRIQEPTPDSLPDDYMKEPRPEYIGENTP